jgi:hypothetical protein
MAWALVIELIGISFLRTHGGVFKTQDMETQFPALDDFQQKWSNELGRDVNFVGYPKPQPRDATEFILRGNK